MSAISSRFLAWTCLAVGALGAVPLAKKLALEAGGTPVAVAVLTTGVAAGLVLAWVIARGHGGRLLDLDRRSALAVLAVGALGSGAVPLMGLLAMTATSASNRALFQSAYPVATAAAAWLLLGERPSWITRGLIVLVCGGLALMNVEGGGDGIGLGWPFWLLLGTLPLIGLADVIAKKALDDRRPETVAAGRVVGGFCVLLLALPWFDARLVETVRLAAPTLAVAGLGMAIFAIALYQVFDRTRASIAASLIALAPVLTLAGEAWMLDVSLTLLQWCGFAVVLAGVIGLARRA
ncbi:DMT family transporter [Halomonas denitrificans]|nr:DMT family transporter [Halomonas denitrificans]